MSVNKIILIGNVGSEPEMRFTGSGKPVADFTLATNRKYGDEDLTTWFKVTAWNKLAETVNQYVYKGMSVYVEGSVGLDEWEGQDGQKRSRLAVTAGTVNFLSKPKEQAAKPDIDDTIEPEDIPF